MTAQPINRNALTSYVSYISDYIPTTVKDAAGLNPQITDDARHVTWITIDRVYWQEVRLFLVIGYTDGFQVWDLDASPREVLSKQDKAVCHARLLSVPLEEEGDAIGVQSAPLLAYVHRSAPALVRLFSMKSHSDVHLLRLTEPARSLQTSRRFFAVGLAKHVELYDALHFQSLFTVQCHSFALGHRWLAYNLPPQQAPLTVAHSVSGLISGDKQLPDMVRDGVHYLAQVSQKTLDHVLMPSHEGVEQAVAATTTHSGIVSIRDGATRAVIAQFEDHTEAVDMMAWDPSGLQLVTAAALGHRILVHRALLNADRALLMHEPGEGLALGSVIFQHLYTFSRGYTPAVISGMALSDDGEFVAVSSAKGTTHVFQLPPPGEAPALRGGLEMIAPKPIQLNVCCRVKLGSVLLQEGLIPQCAFLATRRVGSTAPRMYIVTRAGALALYSLPADAVNEERQAVLKKEVHVFRPLTHFSERRLPSTGARTATPEVPADDPRVLTLGPWSERERQESPLGSPWGSPRMSPAASPRIGPSASPLMGPWASPILGPQTPQRSHVGSRADESVASSKWIAQVEMTTCRAKEVPVWLCPQLTFHSYPPLPCAEINESLRAGEALPGKRIAVSRRQQPGDGRFDTREAPMRTPSMTIVSAWGAIGGIYEQNLEGVVNSSLEQLDGSGSVIDNVEDEDWVKA